MTGFSTCFNRKPEKGLDFLLDHGFVEGSPRSVAHFLISRKGLSKQKIGEFLGNLQNAFNMEVLQYVVTFVVRGHMCVCVCVCGCENESVCV